MKRNRPSTQTTFLCCLCVASLGLFVLGLATPPTLLAAGQAQTVKDFGAVGDGKTDDHAAIQRAINAGIGDIRLPKGHYRITKSLQIDLDRAGYTSISGGGTATLIMAAGGPALHIIGTHNGTAAPGTVKANVWERQRLPLIDGLEIRGAHPEADGILAEGTMAAVFSRLLIRNAVNGITLTGRNRNVIISECHIYDNRGVGILLDKVNLHQINITNSHISYNGGGGVVVRRSEVRNLQIGSCDIEGNMDPEGPPTANILLDVREGSVREGAIIGCTLQHNHDAAGSANIRFLGRSAEVPIKVGYFSISGNALSDVAVNVHLQYVRGVSITGNSFWKGFEHNLLVEGSSNIVVGPNLFDRNPDYQPRDSRNSLLFVDSSDSTLTGLHINGVHSAEAALTLRRCRRFNLTNSMILNSDNIGLLLDDVQHVRVSDNLIRGGSESGQAIALRLTKGSGNMIVDNLLDGKVEIAEHSTQPEGSR